MCQVSVRASLSVWHQRQSIQHLCSALQRVNRPLQFPDPRVLLRNRVNYGLLDAAGPGVFMEEMMSQSHRPPRLVVTWAILIPLLLITTFVFSPGVLVSVLIAAAISPVVHSGVARFYGNNRGKRRDFASRIYGGG